MPESSSQLLTMVVSGTYRDVKTLLDTIENSQYIRISNVSLVFEEDGFGSITTNRINIRFEVLIAPFN